MRIEINDNPRIVEAVREDLEENDGYCPCQTERNEDAKCICKAFIEQESEGYCYCMLYYKYLD